MHDDAYWWRGVSQEVYCDENRLQTTCRSSSAIVADIHGNSKKIVLFRWSASGSATNAD